MDVKVNYDKLYDLGAGVEYVDEELVNLFNDLLKILEDMERGWNGVDYNNFKTIAATYIEEQKDMLDQIDFIGKFMKHASTVYSNSNENWGKSMKKLGENYDDEQKHNNQ